MGMRRWARGPTLAGAVLVAAAAGACTSRSADTDWNQVCGHDVTAIIEGFATQTAGMLTGDDGMIDDGRGQVRKISERWRRSDHEPLAEIGRDLADTVASGPLVDGEKAGALMADSTLQVSFMCDEHGIDVPVGQ